MEAVFLSDFVASQGARSGEEDAAGLDAVGPWRLQAVEGNTAVFQAGDQTRRMAIP